MQTMYVTYNAENIVLVQNSVFEATQKIIFVSVIINGIFIIGDNNWHVAGECEHRGVLQDVPSVSPECSSDRGNEGPQVLRQYYHFFIPLQESTL